MRFRLVTTTTTTGSHVLLRARKPGGTRFGWVRYISVTTNAPVLSSKAKALVTTAETGRTIATNLTARGWTIEVVEVAAGVEVL
jgi:hypothetical protein